MKYSSLNTEQENRAAHSFGFNIQKGKEMRGKATKASNAFLV